YRVPLGGGDVERLTEGRGTHQVALSPGGNYFLDNFSSYDTPPRISIRSVEGKAVRTIDTGPPAGPKTSELVTIPARDGYELYGPVTLPADFDAEKLYPVWFQTYGGPHLPTVSDAWRGGGAADRAQGGSDIIIFKMDPRSASGRGAVSAW